VKAYEFVDGIHFGERKHWLNDDYVKFLRFAQLKMDAREDGIVGVITNRWWLENVTFRGMRQSLLNTFDEIHIVDLHGEAGGGEDKNVFDITKGVAISLFVKNRDRERVRRYASIRGARLAKYKACAERGIDDLAWTVLEPTSPNYFLVPRTEVGREIYESFWSVKKIFVEGSTGILTARDRVVVAETEIVLREQLGFLIGHASDSDVEKRFELKKVGHWSLSDARKRIRQQGILSNLIRGLAYRPFDIQTYYDHDALVFRRRRKVMQEMTNGSIGLAVCRLTKGGDWRRCLVADEPTDDSYVSDRSKERAYLFPMLRTAEAPEGGRVRTENFAPEFLAFLDDPYEHHYTPEEILGCIYAVLHASTYRASYAEFLRIDFPHVPFPEASDDFETLSGLGWTLVQAHLFRELPRRGLAIYHGRGDHVVEFVRYSTAEQAVAINKTQSYSPVPHAVWDFHIGGYQVLDKYLRSRRGRVLSLAEIEHVSAIADSLVFTIDQMASIDAAYRVAFPDLSPSDD